MAVGCLCAECPPEVYTQVLLCVLGLGLPPDTCTDALIFRLKSLTLQWVRACMCVCSIASVVSNSLQLYGLEATRLLFPRDSPSNNTGVGCHALLQGISQPRDQTCGFCMLVDSLPLSHLGRPRVGLHPAKPTLSWKYLKSKNSYLTEHHSLAQPASHVSEYFS